MTWPGRGRRGERRSVGAIDRLVVQQYDPLSPSTIGGIDTCLRGVLDYAPPDVRLAVVGIDDSSGPNLAIGRWHPVRRGDREIAFLPVARIDLSRARRFVPHSARLVAGLIRYRARIPRPASVQAHRVDVGLFVRLLFRSPLVYCIHTQRGGLRGRTSDSFWRFTGGLHERLDRAVARRAERVIVFNPDYAGTVRRWNPRTVSSPTWFDPAITPEPGSDAPAHAVLWVGRLEVPKDPLLAVQAFAALAGLAPDEPWTLDLVGSGSLRPAVRDAVDALPPDVGRRVTLHGRLDPVALARVRSRADLFLMTSHAGYEGFPRVLVEALAAGLPAVVTEGSDTGGLVDDGVSGFVRDRRPDALAAALRAARDLDRTKVAASVAALAAPRVVRDVFFPTAPVEKAGGS